MTNPFEDIKRLEWWITWKKELENAAISFPQYALWNKLLLSIYSHSMILSVRGKLFVVYLFINLFLFSILF